MNRSVKIGLKDVSPMPYSLRKEPHRNDPVDQVDIDLGALFLHHYEDSYPSGPPKPDGSRFEYLELVSGSSDFRFHAHVNSASTVRKRGISAEIGQAFCRLMLQDHFGAMYFAHMAEVLNKKAHPAFGGLTVRRTQAGDVPDYLCAGGHNRAVVAEAKGRFSAVSFHSPAFGRWRDQFARIQVLGPSGRPKRVKGFIVATQFGTECHSRPTCSFIEDPEIVADEELGDDATALGRGTAALHYGTVLRKLNLPLLASALSNGFALARDVQFQVPVWTCVSPPLAGIEFIGGFYRTAEGTLPQLSKDGWQSPWELSAGHGVFVGLERRTAAAVAQAARGEWAALVDLPILQPRAAVSYPSEVAWLPDGVVAAPMTYFVPTGVQVL